VCGKYSRGRGFGLEISEDEHPEVWMMKMRINTNGTLTVVDGSLAFFLSYFRRKSIPPRSS
jgi:hypothetical protein